jgi:hypothetical protein
MRGKFFYEYEMESGEIEYKITKEPVKFNEELAKYPFVKRIHFVSMLTERDLVELDL